MADSYKALTTEISTYVGKLNKDAPNVLKGFMALSEAATADGVLNKKTKELIALGIAVSTRCDGCIGFHSQKLVKLGASREEIVETLSMAVYMGGGPSLMYAAEALKAYEEFSS